MLNKITDKIDLYIVTSLIILSIIGLVTLISVHLSPEGNVVWAGTVQSHLSFLGIGFIALIVAYLIDLEYIRYWQVWLPMYLITLALLIATVTVGPVINNVQRWLVIGGVQIQPSELAKVVVIIYTASLLSYKDRYNQILLAGISGVMTAIIIGLIFIQPNGSMSIITFLLWFFIVLTFLDSQMRNFLLVMTFVGIVFGGLLLYLNVQAIGLLFLVTGVVIGLYGLMAREEWRTFFLVALLFGGIVSIALCASWEYVLRDYQKERIEVFLGLEESSDSTFNVDQARIAIGSGGLFGKGFGEGSQTRLKFLPEADTDFIFASYAEQFGLFGSLFLIGLYLFIIFRFIMIAMQYSGSYFLSIILAGIAIKLFLEAFVNIGTSTNTIPATGIPLPLMSAGGTITVITLFIFGLALNIISQHRANPENAGFSKAFLLD